MMTISLQSINIINDDAIYNNYLDALNIFLESHKQGTVILCGSFAKSKLQMGSDIDLFIIDHKLNKLENKKVIINNIDIEILSCSLDCLFVILKEEKNNFVRRISSYLSYGKLLQGNDENIINKAKYILSARLPILDSNELQKINGDINRYKILSHDYLIRYGDISFFTRMSVVVQTLIQYYFKLNKSIIPSWKDTDTYIKNTLFKSNLIEFYSAKTIKEKYKALINLLNELDNLMSKYK